MITGFSADGHGSEAIAHTAAVDTVPARWPALHNYGWTPDCCGGRWVSTRIAPFLNGWRRGR